MAAPAALRKVPPSSLRAPTTIRPVSSTSENVHPGNETHGTKGDGPLPISRNAGRGKKTKGLAMRGRTHSSGEGPPPSVVPVQAKRRGTVHPVSNAIGGPEPPPTSVSIQQELQAANDLVQVQEEEIQHLRQQIEGEKIAREKVLREKEEELNVMMEGRNQERHDVEWKAMITQEQGRLQQMMEEERIARSAELAETQATKQTLHQRITLLEKKLEDCGVNVVSLSTMPSCDVDAAIQARIHADFEARMCALQTRLGSRRDVLKRTYEASERLYAQLQTLLKEENHGT